MAENDTPAHRTSRAKAAKDAAAAAEAVSTAAQPPAPPTDSTEDEEHEERHDREYWLERYAWFKDIDDRRATRHILAGALHDLVGNTSQDQVQKRIDKFLKGDAR